MLEKPVKNMQTLITTLQDLKIGIDQTTLALSLTIGLMRGDQEEPSENQLAIEAMQSNLRELLFRYLSLKWPLHHAKQKMETILFALNKSAITDENPQV